MFHPSYRTHKNMVKVINTQQTSEPRPSLRAELNSAYNALSMKARAVAGSRNPADRKVWERAVTSMLDISEQLRLLKAIENGEITPIIHGGTIELNRGQS